jgi:hypothetical protein
MGAWGYGPLDNDQALDWLSPIKGRAAKAVGRVYDQGVKTQLAYLDVYAAAQLIVALAEMAGGMYDSDVVWDAMGALEQMLGDNKFMSLWDKPEKLDQEANFLIGQLNAIWKRSTRGRKKK